MDSSNLEQEQEPKQLDLKDIEKKSAKENDTKVKPAKKTKKNWLQKAKERGIPAPRIRVMISSFDQKAVARFNLIKKQMADEKEEKKEIPVAS